MPSYSDEEGEFAVRTARKVVEKFLESGNVPQIQFPKRFEEKSGVFTTISIYPSGELRGCIGYPEPVFPLKEALVNSALAAAFDDRGLGALVNQEVVEEIRQIGRARREA